MNINLDIVPEELKKKNKTLILKHPRRIAQRMKLYIYHCFEYLGDRRSWRTRNISKYEKIYIIVYIIVMKLVEN
jgi:hypothetical protein